MYTPHPGEDRLDCNAEQLQEQDPFVSEDFAEPAGDAADGVNPARTGP